MCKTGDLACRSRRCTELEDSKEERPVNRGFFSLVVIGTAIAINKFS